MRIPFDSLTLAAVSHELQQFVGGKVQRITQPNDFDLVMGIYAGAGEAYLLLSCHPIFSRAHLITKRPGNQPQPPTFCATLRARIEGARISKIG